MEQEREHPGSLVEARKARGWKIDKVAERIGVSRGTIGHWESGTYQPQGPARIALAKVFRVPRVVVDSWFS